ncbi:MAG: hypothetical protein JRI23_24390, partial [Deltaproteobacteria bacterium]|nr:hypothetical protein [Deltaproteobacteria bacterium]MBW2535145.1 hypothetical protein [Deltaproteobacteria bacterium]
MTEPVLRADGARIAIDGATAVASLSLRTLGPRVVLGGDVAPLMRVLMGPASVPAADAAAPAPTATV